MQFEIWRAMGFGVPVLGRGGKEGRGSQPGLGAMSRKPPQTSKKRRQALFVSASFVLILSRVY